MTTAARLLRFNGVGALGVAVQLGTVYVLSAGWGVGHLAATAAGVTTAIVHNFVWHRAWTWADRRDGTRSGRATFSRFVLANGLVSLAGNLACVQIAHRIGGLGAVEANLAGIALCGLANFWAADRAVFRAVAAASQAGAPGVLPAGGSMPA